MHEVLVNSLGGLSLPRKSVVRLTDRPDMTLDVYRGGKTTMQQLQQILTVIKMGKKYEKLFFLAINDTVWNSRNSFSENQPLFEILGNILKLFLATIFGVRIFRVFEVLGKLPYTLLPKTGLTSR